jgi:hypothetical protein
MKQTETCIPCINSSRFGKGNRKLRSTLYFNYSKASERINLKGEKVQLERVYSRSLLTAATTLRFNLNLTRILKVHTCIEYLLRHKIKFYLARALPRSKQEGASDWQQVC